MRLPLLALLLLLPSTSQAQVGPLEFCLGTGDVHCAAKLGLYEAWIAASAAGQPAPQSLPADLRARLAPLFPNLDLAQVRIGPGNPIALGVADCMTIRFSNEDLLDRYLDDCLDTPGGVPWVLLHELRHAEQCAEVGSRLQYGYDYVDAVPGAVAAGIASLQAAHDVHPMELDADARADATVWTPGIYAAFCCEADNDCPIDGFSCDAGRCLDTRCDTDSDCGTRQLCVDEACVEVQCTEDAHCTTGFCFENGCTPALWCRSDADCPRIGTLQWRCEPQEGIPAPLGRCGVPIATPLDLRRRVPVRSSTPARRTDYKRQAARRFPF